MLSYYYPYVITLHLSIWGCSFKKTILMNFSLKRYEIFSSDRMQQQFVLFDGDHKLLSLIYDTTLNTARLESDYAKRLFMVYNEGRRHHKTVFKNEYGFDIGTLEQASENTYGKLEMYENDYYYRLSIQEFCIMTLHDHPNDDPLAMITMEVSDAEEFIHSTEQKFLLHLLNCVLLSVCWYLQLPETAKELFQHSNKTSQLLA